MSNSTNQNATASWSGYSHQGQVGLLVAIKKIIELLASDGERLTDYHVEFEIEEDAAIYKLNDGTKEYLSIHQVKAKYSSGSEKVGKYKEALKNFSQTSCPEKYLHTSKEIENWDKETFDNPQSVLRYEYESGKNYCDTSSIDGYLNIEISRIVGENETGRIQTALHRISNNLDQRIRKEHQEKKGVKKEMKVVFGLDKLYSLILDNSDFDQRLLCALRRKLVKYYYEFFRDIVFDQDGLDYKNDPPKSFTDISNQIFSLDDDSFGEFLNLLDLSKDQDDFDVYSLNRDGLIDVFYLTLFNACCANVDSKLKNESVHYGLENDSFQRVITAINSSKNREGRIAENYLRNWRFNILRWEPHYIINKEIKGRLIEKAPDIKPRTIGISEKGEKDAFMRHANESAFITINDAKDELNDA